MCCEFSPTPLASMWCDVIADLCDLAQGSRQEEVRAQADAGLGEGE